MTNRFIIARSVGCLMVLTLLLFNTSCKKYLDKKGSKSMGVPDKLEDMQALLDDTWAMNQQGPDLPDLLADDHYITSEQWQGLDEFERGNYIWDPRAEAPLSWIQPYTNPIYHANFVFDQLPNISFAQDQQATYNNVKGQALFHRAYSFQQLAQMYCQPYATETAAGLGIVLRNTAVVTVPSKRATVQETYDLIIRDLREAAALLPESNQLLTRPAKIAAWAALARTFLTMRDYQNAGLYADSVLQKFSVLMDYNTMVPVGSPPVKWFNEETIFYMRLMTAGVSYYANVDSLLYQSYHPDDLRKEIFFLDNGDGTHSFQGSYDGTYYPKGGFGGLATDEIYLIRAECYARNGNVTAALADLNRLMRNRWRRNHFTDFTAANAEAALDLILTERRKELLYRGLRWSDMRRLNLEGRHIEPTRIINGTTYTLPVGDLRWVMRIPQQVINLSGIPQNPR